MDKQDAEFLKRLLATFQIEADEHLKNMSAGLLELEKSPAGGRQLEVLEMVFREAHSLKGAARAVNLAPIETVCQSLESLLAALKRREISLSPGLLDTLHQGVDGLGELLASARAEASDRTSSPVPELVRALDETLKQALSATGPEHREEGGSRARDREPGPPSQEDAQRPTSWAEKRYGAAETVRIATSKLDPLVRQAEELVSVKLVLAQRAEELGQVGRGLTGWEKQWTKIQPDMRSVRRALADSGDGNGSEKKNGRLARLVEFLEWNHTHWKSLESKIAMLEKAAERDHRSVGRTVDDLLDGMRTVAMLPFSALLEVFPKLVRDLSRQRGKEAELVIRGGEVEIDRRILETMKDPLIHLVRNCIDHGIEAPLERKTRHKPPHGTITLSTAPQNGNKAEIVVCDDGAGIDLKKVRAVAVKLGMVSAEEAEKLPDPAVISLIFQSGVSTSPIITDVSGRGLGLAIVREKVEELRGTLSVTTERGVGTTFRMVLPLTLATFRGLLVRVGERLFVLPAANVEKVVGVRREEIKTVENRETVPFGGRAISLVRLGEVLGLPRKGPPAAPTDLGCVVILDWSSKRIGFLVDEVLNVQEVLVKSLGKQLRRVRNVSGATVLGNGRVVPILNAPDLMQSAVERDAAAARPAAEGPPEREARKKKSILVAEDSITARTLLRNILDAAGYEVTTAVDGVDAFTKLREGQFDLVVSDVDMPRMSGFGLAAKIRSDTKLAETPVVLVTALESREDRERGIDAGANAYIVKSSFDQSNLLQVLQRLL